MTGTKTAAERNKPVAALCCPAAVSLVFVLMTLGIWQGARYIVYAGLFAGTGFCLWYVLRLRRERTKEKILAALVLCGLVFDYLMWTFFAHYDHKSSYIFLLLEESARLVCLTLVFRYFRGAGSIVQAAHVLMLKFFLLDFPVVMLTRWDPPTSLGIFHPLYPWPLYALFFVHLSVMGFIGVNLDEKSEKGR